MKPDLERGNPRAKTQRHDALRPNPGEFNEVEVKRGEGKSSL